MASNSENCERSIRRTLSERKSFEFEEEEKDTVQKQHRRSLNINDVGAIEEIVTCSIHLGIMEDPKKLQCQHAFCSECLMNLLRINKKLVCPICRAVEECDDVRFLPQALVEKQLIEVVMQRRIKGCSTKQPSDSFVSKEGKEELVKHLLNELGETSSRMFKCDNVEENEENLLNNRNFGVLKYKTPVSSICSSTYDVMDIDTIRENMLKYSCYKDVKRNCIRKLCKTSILKMFCSNPPEFSTFDVHLLNDKTNAHEIVFVDSKTNKVYVFSETELRSFFIRLDSIILKPSYIRVINDDLFVTGLVSDCGVAYFVFLQCNLYGKIIRKTDLCQYIESNSTFPMISGFDIDKSNEKYFLCMPHINKIQVYNIALIDCQQTYDFDNNQPEFVTFYQSQNQIWVSCPQNRKILIADIDSKAFMMFRTDQINEAIPKMIYCTSDERVIFLDTKSNRFIWIKRRGDYILTQKLHFRSISEHLPVKAFQVLPFSLIVVCTSSEFLVYEPVKLKSKLKSSLSSCSLI